MNWYFAISGASLDRHDHDWPNLIRVAVQSAQANTTLKPHLIYDGRPGPFTEEMSARGVEVIFHRVVISDALQAHGSPEYWAVARGAFLRFDIPLFDRTDFALYTDCDVMFKRDPDFGEASAPPLFSATSQASENIAEDMNSGVMLMNIPAMRERHPALVRFTEANLDLGLDQEILRVFYDGQYTPADRAVNWKPYWGVNPDAQIVHFHGPKPVVVRRLERGEPTHYEIWQVLYDRARSSYAEYLRQWDEHLDAYHAQAGG